MNYFWHFSPRKIIEKCKKIRLNETLDSEMLKLVMKGDKDLTTHLQLNHHPMLWFYQRKKKTEKWVRRKKMEMGNGNLALIPVVTFLDGNEGSWGKSQQRRRFTVNKKRQDRKCLEHLRASVSVLLKSFLTSLYLCCLFIQVSRKRTKVNCF